jgi:hypothetical protein
MKASEGDNGAETGVADDSGGTGDARIGAENAVLAPEVAPAIPNRK